MKKQVLSILILIFTACITNAQTDATLAQQFMSNGEYDKAADIYKKLFNENSNSNYKPYYNCLMLLNDFKEIERIAEKQMKKNPDNRKARNHCLERWQTYAHNRANGANKIKPQHLSSHPARIGI